jgi:hypothetical protein
MKAVEKFVLEADPDLHEYVSVFIKNVIEDLSISSIVDPSLEQALFDEAFRSTARILIENMTKQIDLEE